MCRQKKKQKKNREREKPVIILLLKGKISRKGPMKQGEPMRVLILQVQVVKYAKKDSTGVSVDFEMQIVFTKLVFLGKSF